jgi:hypothetical protein
MNVRFEYEWKDGVFLSIDAKVETDILIPENHKISYVDEFRVIAVNRVPLKKYPKHIYSKLTTDQEIEIEIEQQAIKTFMLLVQEEIEDAHEDWQTKGNLVENM